MVLANYITSVSWHREDQRLNICTYKAKTIKWNMHNIGANLKTTFATNLQNKPFVIRKIDFLLSMYHCVQVPAYRNPTISGTTKLER